MKDLRNRFLVILFLIFGLSSGLNGQLSERYKKTDYYGAPMKIPMILSGNFAETRLNHFHSGIDIRTQGKEGVALYSVADGYIARVGIAPAGFGRVLYIAHPNGTTTVYAHMQWFTDEVEAYVVSQRYRLKQHRVDLYPEQDKFVVKKGDFIGRSGNSGSSAGPHLHFEIRESASQRTMNVAKMDIYSIEDNIPPRIAGLYLIETDTINSVPIHSSPRAVGVRKISDTTYTLTSAEPLMIGTRTHFVVEATDRKNDTYNTFGIYSLDAVLDGEPFFSFRLDDFLFAQTRYVNSLCHFALQKKSRNEMLRLAVQDGNRLPIYGEVRNRGLIMLEDDLPHNIKIVIEDDNRNVSTLSFVVKRRSDNRSKTTPEPSRGVPVDHRKTYNRSSDGLDLKIPAGALYEPIMFEYGVNEVVDSLKIGKATLTHYSPIYTIHNEDTPLHTNISIAVVPKHKEVPENLRAKLCFARLNDDGTVRNGGGRYEGGSVVVVTRLFGRYCVVADTVSPTISSPFVDGANLRGARSFSLRVTDDFSGVASYSATIDGQWIPFEQKGTRITHHFDPNRIKYSGGTHTLRVVVLDEKGNATTLERKFVR